MKNLIITLSFFLLLPLTGHANGLMKFKKVKQGEKVAPTKTSSYSAPVVTKPAVNIEYAMGLRNALVKFMIQLEKDVEAKKVSRFEAEKILQLLRNNLFVAEAMAQTRLTRGSQCFAGGWPSTIQSNGDCGMPSQATTGCAATEYRCSDSLFGSNTCVPRTSRGRGFTAACEAKADPTALREELLRDPAKLAAMQQTNTEATNFCNNWQSTHRSEYNGCAELKKRTAALSAAAPIQAQAQTNQPEVRTEVAPIRTEPAVTTAASTVNPQPAPVRGPSSVRIGGGTMTAGGHCTEQTLSKAFLDFANLYLTGSQKMETRESCNQIKSSLTDMLGTIKNNNDGTYTADEKRTANNNAAQVVSHDCSKICIDPVERDRLEAERVERENREKASEIPGAPKARYMGNQVGTAENYGCFNPEILTASCKTLLTDTNINTNPDDIQTRGTGTQKQIFFKAVERSVDFENPHSFIKYFMGPEAQLSQAMNGYKDSITQVKVCRLLASGCTPIEGAIQAKYEQCIENAETGFSGKPGYKRAIIVGIEKSLAIVAAAKETTEFESDDNYGGTPFECKGNKGDNAGLGFDHPKCKKFYNWYVGLEATSTGFKVGNEAAVTTENMRNQTRLQQQIEEGNGQDAGFEASRNASIASQKAEERNMGFFAAKGALILAQLNNWPSRKNICDGTGCCELFRAEGPDRIDRDFFPNADAKNHIYAQAIAAATEVMVAKFKADLHKENARKVQAIKEQMQFTDDSEEGVMKFCLQFPQDVRCLSPGQRRALGASGTQFGSFQGSNFGLGSLEGEQGNEVSAGQDFGGSLAAGGPSGNVGNIGSADKDAAAAKNIFNAPAAARGGGGGGAGGGAGGGGGGGGSAQSGQLSRDEGLKEDKKESPIEITSKKAAYEGSKGGYNGGGYNPSNKKPGESPTANPFAGMFGKDQGRDPANVAEIDKPASDLFSKISRRYGEVQKRKALMEVADEGNGIR